MSFLKQLIIFAIVLSTIFLLPASLKAAPIDEENSPDALIEIETMKMPHYFNYKESNLRPVTKVATFYSLGSGSAKHIAYKDFFYSGRQPIGMKMRSRLGLRPKTSVSIQLKHLNRDNGSVEICAGINSIIRIFVDLILNNNYPTYVAVPDESFEAVVENFSHYHFYTVLDPRVESYDQGITAIKLRDYSGNKQTEVYFSKDKQ